MSGTDDLTGSAISQQNVCGADRMGEACAVSWTKDVPVSLMSSTSTKHILSNSVWEKMCVS